jgi:hypothetical protein
MVKTKGGYQTCTSGSEARQRRIVFLVMSFKRKTLHLHILAQQNTQVIHTKY